MAVSWSTTTGSAGIEHTRVPKALCVESTRDLDEISSGCVTECEPMKRGKVINSLVLDTGLVHAETLEVYLHFRIYLHAFLCSFLQISRMVLDGSSSFKKIRA